MICDKTLGPKICAYLGRQPEVSARVANRLYEARTNALMHAGKPGLTWMRWEVWHTPRAGFAAALLMLGILIVALLTSQAHVH